MQKQKIPWGRNSLVAILLAGQEENYLSYVTFQDLANQLFCAYNTQILTDYA
jgi:hypothetical protein